MKIFAVHDSKAEIFGTPIFLPTLGLAIRAFADQVNNPEPNPISQHPEDYTLFDIGEYNQETGELIANKTPKSCGLALEFKQE